MFLTLKLVIREEKGEGIYIYRPLVHGTNKLKMNNLIILNIPKL